MKKIRISTLLAPQHTGTLFLSAFLIATLFAGNAFGQADEARQAIERGEYVRAVNILSEALGNNPSPDVYLNLGSAYGHMKEYQKAEDILREGSQRYPNDVRFHNELANLFIENNDVDAAKKELRNTLTVEPDNGFASDQLATIDMSEGDVQSALRTWNKSGRPFISDILHNYYLTFGSWVVRRAVAFHPSGTLRYSEWKTTEARLFETENFANVGLEIEPTRIPDQYNAVVRTTRKTNTLGDLAFNLVKGAPWETSYVNVWDIANSGVNFNADYRWQTNRRRLDGQFKLPLPVAGLLSLELGSGWRSERWNVSNNVLPQYQQQSLFDYGNTAFRIQTTQIPNYRVEISGGFAYLNRNTKGSLPHLYDSLNTGLFSVATNLLLVDGNKHDSRLRLEAFAARRSIVGENQFAGGTAQINTRYTLSKDTRTYFDWSLKGGTARGGLPIDNYFLLGVDTQPTNLLRGHRTTKDGKYGNGPMGTDFVLLNTDVERKLATVPFFNNFNIPYVNVKWELFFDSAKTWDRNHIFKTSKLLLDTGGAIRLETPTHSLNLGYGRSLREANNVFFLYFEQRLW